MNRIASALKYLNPIAHLGDSRYSIRLPLVLSLLFYTIIEIYAHHIIRDTTAVSFFIIFSSFLLIIYLSFLRGIPGGVIATTITIAYYIYLMNARQYSGEQLTAGLRTTFVLAMIYLPLALTIGWLKQIIDRLIQNQVEAKNRLRAIIEQLPVGVVITNSQGDVVQRNKRVDTIFGMHMPYGFKFGRETKIQPHEEPLQRTLKTGKPVIGREMEYHHRNGRVLHLRINAAPIRNRHGKIIAAASIINDITQRKELEQQKDNFLAIASHELKTPVTSIKAYGQVLQALFKKERRVAAVEYLQKMDTQINKLTFLIEDLLDVTKIQAGKLKFNETDFELNALINEIVEHVQLTTTKHVIVTKLGRRVRLHADRDRVGQVLTNLLTNAIKYSPHAEEIVITAKVAAGRVIVSVQDFGVGIPKDKKDKVFEQFFRVSGPKENTFPGLGLGLYISAEIIKREGGKIWVESTVGKGSTFYFSLPLPKSRTSNLSANLQPANRRLNRTVADRLHS